MGTLGPLGTCQPVLQERQFRPQAVTKGLGRKGAGALRWAIRRASRVIHGGGGVSSAVLKSGLHSLVCERERECVYIYTHNNIYLYKYIYIYIYVICVYTYICAWTRYIQLCVYTCMLGRMRIPVWSKERRRTTHCQTKVRRPYWGQLLTNRAEGLEGLSLMKGLQCTR